jgi:FemAB-related protein (PEP-CTERM system-associated)
VVQEVFGHVPHYIAVLEHGAIQGVLPLFEVHGLLSGHALISVPYAVYGGLCATGSAARETLVQKAGEMAQRLGVRHVELRHLFEPVAGLATHYRFATFAKPIGADPDANFAAIPRKKRRMIRQGIKCGLKAQRGWEPLAEFYEVYAVNRRKLGAPLFPKRLFTAIREHFGTNADLLTVSQEGRVVAGVVSFFFRERVMPYYGAALPEALCLGVNDFMYWELLKESGLAGYRTFDFGQSHPGSGTYDFKRYWGFQPEPLAYQYMVLKGRGIPSDPVATARRRLLVETWKHLPLPLTKWVGPALTRWLPLH